MLKSFLSRSVGIYSLVTFRILLGILLIISTIRFMYLGWIEDHYSEPIFHFKYYGFEWVEALNVEGLYLVHYALIISSLCLCLGLFYRLSAILTFLLFSYTELIELSYYLNHYYYVSLVCFLMIFLPAHRYYSLDVYFKRTKPTEQIPFLYRAAIPLMAWIVYSYAGYAKINTYWLIEAMPLKIWLPANNHLPVIGPLFEWSLLPYIFSWAGMIFDVSIVYFLLFKKTRPYAFTAVVVFHLLTGLLFYIGIFPLVMIASASLFFPDSSHQNFLHLFIKKNRIKRGERHSMHTSLSNVHYICFFLFFAVQLIFPWRYLAYDGNLFWNEEGYRFSWRVMLMEKSGTATFYIQDGKKGVKRQVSNGQFMNPHQEKQMATQSDMIVQYAHFLGKHYGEKGYKNPIITVESYVTLNGRPSQLFIDPTVNLLDKNWHSWKQKDWVLPAVPAD